MKRILVSCFVFILCLQANALRAQDVTYEPKVAYEVETCCQLCPAAADPETYATGRLRGMRMLVDGEDGWLFRTRNDYLEAFGPDADALERLSAFVAQLHTAGVELMIVYIPTRGMLHPQEIKASDLSQFNVEKARASYEDALLRLRSTGALVPNLSEVYRKPIDADYYFKRDHHWTPEGAKYSAKVIAEYVKSLPIYATLTKTDFITRKAGVFRRTGQFQLAAKRICGFDYPAQYPNRYVTEVAPSEDLSEDALFGDSALPEVVLVGTSNSWNNNQDFNFSGFLKEYLSVDILNESITGGNFDGALVQYLLSDAFKESKPKLMIWELPSYYDLIEYDFYRRVIPMVGGGCDDRDVVVSSTTDLGVGRNEILFNGRDGAQRLSQKRLIMDLKFDNPSFHSFKGYIWYVHGRREPFTFNISERVDTQGRFVFDASMLMDEEDFLYLSTDIYIPEDTDPVKMPKRVSAKLCLKDY